MTLKKCDKCGKIYEKGYVLSYSLDNCEVGRAEALRKPEYTLTRDLCETCARRLKMFLRSKEEYEKTETKTEHFLSEVEK